MDDIPESRLLWIVNAFGRFCGRSSRMLDAAARVAPEHLAACEVALGELADALEREDGEAFREEARALAARIRRDLRIPEGIAAADGGGPVVVDTTGPSGEVWR